MVSRIEKNSRFQSIRQASKNPELPSEFLIRQMVKAGTCPGFYSGRKYIVDTLKLIEKLNAGEFAGNIRNQTDTQ